MKRVVLIKIAEYDPQILKQKIKDTLEQYFPLDEYFSLRDKILLKPNLLMPSSPHEAITTHPAIIETLGAILKEKGFDVFVADSPGGFVSERDMDYVYQNCELKDVAGRTGLELLYPTESVVRQGIPLCWWAINEGRRNSFKMINVPKLKTHDIMVLTLAVKNLYGCISGLYKSHLHKVYPRAQEFSEVLISLYQMIKPSLNIVDGILAMEGRGPSKGGSPRRLGIVIMGNDALYTDFVISRLLGLKDEDNPLLKKAKEKGLFKEKELEFISEDESFKVKDFVFGPPAIMNQIPRPFFGLLKAFIKFRPVINKDKCTACGICVKVCPQAAIEMKKQKAAIDYSKCIMCMCCSEMCRFGAVDLQSSLFVKAAKKLGRVRSCTR
ncbi:MAG: DUF362 domain-containing protein [Candidatus Omnitrophota bacterium]|nr:MAG: DUF362 domain-containing protein [Candidatus Omnitrophota bacterium]